MSVSKRGISHEDHKIIPAHKSCAANPNTPVALRSILPNSLCTLRCAPRAFRSGRAPSQCCLCLYAQQENPASSEKSANYAASARMKRKVDLLMRLEDRAKAFVDVAERLSRARWLAIFVDCWLAVSVKLVVSIVKDTACRRSEHT